MTVGETARVHKHGPQKQTARDKKLRSKSLGPGGLDALNGADGNRRKVKKASFILAVELMFELVG